MSTKIRSKDPMKHIDAKHQVVVFWKEETAGYVENHPTWGLSIYQSEGLESGPTEEVRCWSCDMILDLERIDL